MYTFPELIKKIRKESCLSQEQLANVIGVSTVLIAMVETGQKKVSKNLLTKLAEKMQVHPASITPFIFIDKDNPIEAVSGIEKKFIQWGEQMQEHLIRDKAKLLKLHENS